jgi:hypothetical protein
MWSDRRGVAAVEFAIIASFLLLLVLGLYDIGNAIHQRMLLQQALRAGGQYAILYPDQTGDGKAENNGIVEAIAQALPVNGSGVIIAQPVMSPDVGYGPPYYITLGASLPYAALLPFFNHVLTENSASYVVRVQ